MLGYHILSAVVQGISEAFPISSSFHFLVLSQWMNPNIIPSKSMAAGLHIGSFLALCLIFRFEILTLFRIFFQYFRKNSSEKYIKFHSDRHFFNSVAVSVFGLAVGYGLFLGLSFLLKRIGLCSQQPSMMQTAVLYIVFALALECANRWQKKRLRSSPRSFPLLDAFWMGMSQLLAMIFPGASRLGVTLTVGRMQGYSLETCTRFSLIFGLPVLAASIIFSFPEISVNPKLFLQMAMISFLCSWPMFHLMFWLAQRESTTIFTIYRIALGLFLIGLQIKGIRYY